MPDQVCQIAANPAAFRAELRRRCIAARLSMPAAVHAAGSECVRRHLAALLLPRPPGIIAFCAAVRGEVDCQPLVESLIAAGWQAAMPVVTRPKAPMTFRAWSPDTPMSTDAHGIPIPAQGRPAQPGIVLLPLVAFDAAGYRLGYGGGYFDRTLPGLVPIPLAIGVGFELGAVETILPGPHDHPLDWLVTEAGSRAAGPARRDFS